MDNNLKKYFAYRNRLDTYLYAMRVITIEGETIAPKKAYQERGEALSVLNNEYLALSLSDEFNDIIKNLEKNYDKYDEKIKRLIKLERKKYDLEKKVPINLQNEYVHLVNETQHFWHMAKEKDDYSIFEPYFDKLINKTLEIATYYGKTNGSYYNTFLDMYEEGITTEILDTFFNNLKNNLVPLIKKISESNVTIRDDFLKRKVNKKKQMKVADYILKTIGFDLSRGLLQESMHPFTDQLSKNDVRITTHIYEDNFISNIYSCAHEGGHGIYEQNLNSKLPSIVKDACSMSIHESQSRLYENIIARSYAFTKLTYPKIQKLVKPALDDVTLDEYYNTINKVTPSLIRTEADEVTYCLHVLIRYEIEKMIFNREITAKDIPSIWNQKYQEYLGVKVPSDKYGVLQDSHWAGGAFGYFFSYALGNAYSGQIAHYLNKDINLDNIDIASLKAIKKWLCNNIYQYGSLYPSKELIKHINGEEFDSKYYIEYLVDKYQKIYNL